MNEAALLAEIETLGWSVDGTVTLGAYQFWDRKQAQCSKITGDVIEFRNFDYIVPEGYDPETSDARYLGVDPNVASGFDAILAYCNSVVPGTFAGYVLEHYDSGGRAVVRFYTTTGSNMTEGRFYVHDDGGGYDHYPIV